MLALKFDRKQSNHNLGRTAVITIDYPWQTICEMIVCQTGFACSLKVKKKDLQIKQTGWRPSPPPDRKSQIWKCILSSKWQMGGKWKFLYLPIPQPQKLLMLTATTACIDRFSFMRPTCRYFHAIKGIVCEIYECISEVLSQITKKWNNVFDQNVPKWSLQGCRR